MKDLSVIDIALHAEEIFTRLRWPAGPVCPRCGSHHYYKCSNGNYKCKDCHKIYSIKTDSLFHGSHLPLSYWLVALYLMVDGRGISSYQLASKLQVTQKTAWYMLSRIRVCLDLDDVKLNNEIAMDEVYIGGTWRCFSLKKRNQLLEQYKLPKKPKTPKEKMAIASYVNSRYKQPVYGLNDGDKLVMYAVPNPVKPEDLIEIFNKHSNDSGQAVSDCSTLYKDWKDKTGYELHTNNHSKGQFVADNGSSSNRIEGTFSWTHRSNVFNYVHFRKGYTQLYLNEFCFRWNTRGLNKEDRLEQMMKKCCRKVNRKVLKTLNEEEYKLIRNEDWFNPEEFFKNEGCIMKQVERGGIIYRKEEYVLRIVREGILISIY